MIHAALLAIRQSSFIIMAHYHFIGSTGLLKDYQCQNDIWITAGRPNLPVARDARLVVHGVNIPLGVVYYKGWDPLNKDWEVWTMPAGIIAQI